MNTARGELLDDTALASALESGKLAGASLDVHWNEPFVRPTHALANAPNLICTPHSAWYSQESRLEMKTIAASYVDKFIRGQYIPNCVNKRELCPPTESPISPRAPIGAAAAPGF